MTYDLLAVLHQKTENRPQAHTEAPPLSHVLEAFYECMARPTYLPRLQAFRYLARRRELAARGAPERPLNAGQRGPCGFSKQGETMPENERSSELLQQPALGPVFGHGKPPDENLQGLAV